MGKNISDTSLIGNYPSIFAQQVSLIFVSETIAAFDLCFCIFWSRFCSLEGQPNEAVFSTLKTALPTERSSSRSDHLHYHEQIIIERKRNTSEKLIYQKKQTKRPPPQKKSKKKKSKTTKLFPGTERNSKH